MSLLSIVLIIAGLALFETVSPSLGPIGSLTATFSEDPKVIQAIESSAPKPLLSDIFS